jgi:hypothetical protein
VIRPDNRLLDAPMQPVECQRCGAVVTVRKSSWEQTSIQWNAAAAAACEERRSARPEPGPNGTWFPGCLALRDSVREAALAGTIAIADE